jgi:hypothetical protein
MLLVLPKAIADDPTTQPDSSTGTPSSTPTIPKPDLNEAKSKIIDTSNKFLDKEVTLPAWMQSTAKTLFGFGKTVTITQLIITLLIFIIIFSILREGLINLSPFSEETSTIIAFCATLIMSVLGVFTIVTTFLTGVAGFFKWLKNFGRFDVILILLLIWALWLVIYKVIGLNKILIWLKLMKIREKASKLKEKFIGLFAKQEAVDEAAEEFDGVGVS